MGTVGYAPPGWYGYGQHQCGAMLASDLVCTLPASHRRNDAPGCPTDPDSQVRHKAHDPSGSGGWIEFDGYGRITDQKDAPAIIAREDPQAAAALRVLRGLMTDDQIEARVKRSRSHGVGNLLPELVDSPRVRETLGEVPPRYASGGYIKSPYTLGDGIEGDTMSETEHEQTPEERSERDYVEVYIDEAGEHRWRYLAFENDEPLAGPQEGYTDALDMMRAIARVTTRVPQIVESKASPLATFGVIRVVRVSG